MADGLKDLSTLFSRVSALEQDEMSVEDNLANIVKVYARLGFKVKFKTILHQYPICGDTAPLAAAYPGDDFYI